MQSQKLPWWLGLPPQILGYRKDGRPIYLACGGADDDGGDDTGGEGGDGDSGAGDAGKEGDSGKDDSGSAGDDPAELKRQLANALDRMRAADKRAAEKEAALKKIQDADLGELEKAKKDNAELQSENGTLKEANSKLRIQVAMLQDDSYSWHDPADVLTALEKDENVAIDDEGKVSGVKEALKRLATAKPYLVKTPAGDTGEGGASGDAGAGRSKDKNAATRADVIKKFPALRARVNADNK